MPETLTSQEVNSNTDPSVSKQYDNSASVETQITDFYSIVDGLNVGLLGTYRPGVGPVHRSMGVAKRVGPDFLFLANAHSKKFEDLEKGKEVSVTFQDSKTQNWVSVTGKAITTSNGDKRIEEVWNQSIRAWFGDLGDGKHTGGPEDPRMTLIEVKANYVVYWKAEVGLLGFAKEVIGAAATGGVANTGVIRELKSEELEKARSMKE
jgi:general stress protein 26